MGKSPLDNYVAQFNECGFATIDHLWDWAPALRCGTILFDIAPGQRFDAKAIDEHTPEVSYWFERHGDRLVQDVAGRAFSSNGYDDDAVLQFRTMDALALSGYSREYHWRSAPALVTAFFFLSYSPVRENTDLAGALDLALQTVKGFPGPGRALLLPELARMVVVASRNVVHRFRPVPVTRRLVVVRRRYHVVGTEWDPSPNDYERPDPFA